MRQWYDPAKKKRAKTKKEELKIEDFRHAGNENKQSRQNHQNIFYLSTQKSKWAIEEKLLSFPYTTYIENVLIWKN